MRAVRDVPADRALRLILAAQRGDQYAADTLCRELRPTVNAIAYRFFFPGADHDDIVQTGMIGVLAGIRTFRLEQHRNDDPGGFLLFCAQRAIIAGMVAARRYRHDPINKGVSFETGRSDGEGESYTLADMVSDGRDVHEQVELRTELEGLVLRIRTLLTPLERDSMLRVVNGEPYVDDKAVDNAVQRARRKLRQAA